jgi:hypothetical protein
VNTHNWNGSVYQTYNTSGNWVNKLTGFKLTDWTSINTLEQMFVNILDPVLRKPIMVEPKDMLVMPATRYTAKNILHATEVRQTVPGFADTGLPITEVSPNPLDRTYAIMSTANAYRMMTNEAGKTPEQANDIVILGDFKKAFCWREAKPLQVVEAPANNPLDFHNDIVLAVKASYMGVAGITDPRYVVYATSEDA